VTRLNGKTLTKSGRIASAAEVQKEFDFWANKGWDSYRKAVELGPKSTELFLHGAWLTSTASRRDPSWRRHALDCLTQCVDHGYDAGRIKSDSVFLRLRDEPKFQELLLRTAKTAAPPKAVRTLDPVPDWDHATLKAVKPE
jgi:hypothetical protein